MIKDIVWKIHFQLEDCEGGFRPDGVSSNVEVTVERTSKVLCSVFGLLYDGVHVLAESIYKTSLGCGCCGLNC
jgi:hypothetical protein